MTRTPWILLLALSLACVQQPPRTSGPRTLGEAAALTPEGPRRASIQLSQQAAEALERGDPRQARGLGGRALRVDQANPYAYWVMARVAFAEGDRAAAERDLDQAERLLVSQEPRNLRWQGRLMRFRARLRADAGDRAEAQRLLREAERLDPVPRSGGAPGRVIEQTP